MPEQDILLINPNRYAHPPVMPIGLEYVGHGLTLRGFRPHLLDLCFSEAPQRDTAQTVRECRPAAVCVSIRNNDSVLYPDTEFFLPEIKDIISSVRQASDCPVIIGGAGLGVGAQEVLDFVGADFAVEGPGERTIPEVLSAGPEALRNLGAKVIRGAFPASMACARCTLLRPDEYLRLGGIGGFETHKGCSSSCPYCTEAQRPVMLKNPLHVIDELRQLVERGVDHLHLCDSEFNEDVEHAEAMLEAMVEAGLPLKWTLYMRPGHYSARMFDLLGRSGAYLISISTDTCGCGGGKYWADINRMIELAHAAGIKANIDFLGGFPREPYEVLTEAIEGMLRSQADDIVLNSVIRMYKSLPLTHAIMNDPDQRRHLLFEGDEIDSTFLRPVFFCAVKPDELRTRAGTDKRVRIAGEEKTVNYLKA